MTTGYDYEEDKPDSDKLAQLSKLAEQQRNLERDIEELLTQVEDKKKDLKHIAEHQLPGLMDELGMEDFSTTSGLKIEVKEKVRASIPKARQQEAINWLDENGFSKLVKRAFVILFNREDEKWAAKFARDLKQRKRQLDVEQKQDVHNRTLVAFINEQLREGKDIPLELFGVFRQRVSQVTVKGGK